MDWWRGAVFYQVYPRSFLDTDGNGVGDLTGIEARLDHIAELGVDAVWLSPVFRSPMKDFGYDVSDYCDIDPVFGTLSQFDSLVSAVHARGLKLIIDQVWSHTSNEHPWFRSSAAERDGDKSDWYVWAEAKSDGSPPNNWQSVFGGPAWTWSARRRQYYLHNFLAEQPDLNFHTVAVQDAILETARFWLDRGVDGFRLDVANYYAHDPQLRDNPPAGRTDCTTPYGFQRHLYNRSRPETLGVIPRLRALLDRYSAIAVGEIYDDDPLARQREYTDGLDRLHTAYSFFLLEAPHADVALFTEALQAWQGARGWPAWALDNHDAVRFATRLAGESCERVKQLLALLLCLRGSPFIYQGDELGLPHARVPFERLQDPFAIAAYAGESGRDGARTPMPWTVAGPSAGFSTSADTWLPIDPRHRALAVEAQAGDPRSVLRFLQAFIRLRKTLAPLVTGEVDLLGAPEGVLAFERREAGTRILCLFELSGCGARYALDRGGKLLESGLAASLTDGVVLLPPYGAALVLRT